VLPMLFGTDARSGAMAQAYAVDDNNLTLSGGDFDGFDMARLWGPGYVGLLEGLDELPVSVDAEMMSLLAQGFQVEDFPESPEEFAEYDGDIETTNVCPKCGYEW